VVCFDPRAVFRLASFSEKASSTDSHFREFQSNSRLPKTEETGGGVRADSQTNKAELTNIWKPQPSN
jgi:hypothetical protein